MSNRDEKYLANACGKIASYVGRALDVRSDFRYQERPFSRCALHFDESFVSVAIARLFSLRKLSRLAYGILEYSAKHPERAGVVEEWQTSKVKRKRRAIAMLEALRDTVYAIGSESSRPMYSFVEIVERVSALIKAVKAYDDAVIEESRRG